MTFHTLHPHVARLFPRPHARRTRRLGIEQELLTCDAVDGSVVSIERVRQATLEASYAEALGFEPGGQVELSLPCSPTLAVLDRQWQRAISSARADCARADILLESTPVDQREGEIPLQLGSARYVAMQEHLDRIGPAGRRMMRRTASTQVCLDWWPGAAGLEQWRLMQLAGPFLAAAFARSHGPTSRLATWLEVDPSRTAFDDRLLSGQDPVRAYAGFAASAGAFRPSPTEHLTTLFPPVRPRGRYLEVRHLDAQPDDIVPAIAALLAVLLYDDEARWRALRRLFDEGPRLAGLWQMAAERPEELADDSRWLVTTGLRGLARAPAGYLPEGVATRLHEHLETTSLVGAG